MSSYLNLRCFREILRQSRLSFSSDVYEAAAFFSLYVAIIFLISAMALPGFSPCGDVKQAMKKTELCIWTESNMLCGR